MEIRKTNLLTTLSLSASLAISAIALSGCNGSSNSPTPPPVNKVAYEIWASDQSNSTAGAGGLGVSGSYIYVWDSADVETQLAGGATAKPLGCGADANKAAMGPCDINDIFPANLTDEDGNALRTATDPNGFGRLHGMLSDPQGKYMNFNLFKTGGDGGLVGIMDAETKTAVALFRVAQTSAPGGNGRSVHMSFWNKDGSALFVANLHGKLIEKIEITRDATGKITAATLRRDAAVGAGKGLTIVENSHAYSGKNAVGVDLVSAISGSYGTAVTGDLTPAGKCKENGCTNDPNDNGAAGGRPNNVIICPIVSDTGMIYMTMAAGGMLVADTTKTPMKIVAEYGNNEVNGVGCGGVHIGDKVWFDNGVSAVGSGEPMSIFGVYTVDDSAIAAAAAAGNTLAENTPAINSVFKDPGNTAHAGNNAAGAPATNTTGQVPGITTRRDAHGMIPTLDQKYLHVVDRIQNKMEVFETASETHVGSYDLTSADGQGAGTGPCEAASVTDDAALPTNDPAPDLMGLTPDGKYIVAALRGPAPVTVTHGAQGSCPGVGMIELNADGSSGKLVSVLRTSNTTDDATPATVGTGDPGLHPVYSGAERSDVHGATTRVKQ